MVKMQDFFLLFTIFVIVQYVDLKFKYTKGQGLDLDKTGFFVNCIACKQTTNFFR